MMRAIVISGLMGVALGLSGCVTSGHVPHQLPQVQAQPVIMNKVIPVNSADTGLTWAQTAELNAIAAEYKARGHGPLIIAYPERTENTPALVQAAAWARAHLNEQGIAWQNLRGAGMDLDADAPAHLLVTYMRYQAVADKCPGGWEDMTMANLADNHARFGCATAQNFAAIISDPHDLIAPRGSDPASTERRQTVTDAYQSGERTASQRNDGESGAVSTAIRSQN
ncbi:CpaD family pilus assembly lipoprotein [Woodsholea maritima]|uniref:CpaD family pilus assembly lipoprotein n=1 Tax=Woodsholea maritima TaxID=240237 RepID=UPI00035DB442|nr:CpaD family pilus assembly lipoprotein [Woodsholea maritima]